MGNKEEIDNLRALEAAARPGPWTTTKSTWKSKADPNYTWSASGIEQDEDVFGNMASAIAYAQSTGQIRNEDAQFIAAARNALPGLLDELEALRAENTRLRAFWAVVDSYLARGGDAADYLPIDVLAAWQEAL